MSLSTNQSIIRGSFTSDGASQSITLPWEPAKIELLNITQFGSAAGTTPVITAEWRQGMPEQSVITGTKTNAAATIDIPAMNTTNGVSVEDLSSLVPGSEISGTAVTRGGTTTVTAVGHGLKVNDNIIMYNTTGMLQIAGYQFVVQTVPTADTFTLTLDSSGFAADATAVTIRKYPVGLYFPNNNPISTITQASQAVVTVTDAFAGEDIYPVGTIVKLVVPAAYGMVEIDGLQGEVVAVSGGSLTLDIDSSSFTAFAFPTSAIAAAGVTPAQLVPVGKDGVPVSFSSTTAGASTVTNQTVYQVTLGDNAIGGASDVMQWIAYRSLAI